MNYYYLIASLPEISIDDPKPDIGTSDTLDLIFRNLDEIDLKLARYLIYENDNQNLLNAILEHYHRFPPSDFKTPSIYTSEEILQFLKKDSDLPDYMTNYLKMFRDKLDLLRPSRLEEYLWIEFYDEVGTLSNSFIRDYFVFDKILRQLATIRNLKIYEVSLASEFVNDKINRELNISRPKSIISKTYPFVGDLWDALDKQEPYLIEKTMDKIRWNFIENYDPLSHFSNTEVFGSILKLVIRDRWIKLSTERGKKHFEELCDQALIKFRSSRTGNIMTKGRITSIVSNLITIEVDGPVIQNEICLLIHGKKRLKAEVIRVNGTTAYAQVFETTRGIKTGMEVEFTSKMLEIDLGPGILSRNFDGLQSDLDKMKGTFLRTGEETEALDTEMLYVFEPLAIKGQEVQAGDWMGMVMENWMEHKIMVPFALEGTYMVKSIVKKGDYTINNTIATLLSDSGEEIPISMVQKWPVKVAIPTFKRKIRPFDILQTGLRVIDTFNPITEGGTGFVPGAFGTGKTVLQQAISKNGEADIIIIVGCGERANEIVDIFTEFPNLIDPRSGRKLQERTTIVCNTSNMPVATREASVYVGMTIGEYYRNMGHKVLVLADSTSRWAQSLREISNRLEELPGPDAYPVELSATVANFYSRAGYVELNNGKFGSVTFIGTVSPAGGNFKEPVTESTRKVASCFYALSQKRADAKRYPAIDPITSYSKYLEYDEFRKFTDENIEEGWTDYVNKALDIIRMGIEARDHINILGDDAVPPEYHVRFWRRETFDFGFVQQDSFDDIDMNTPLDRQRYMLHKILDICEINFEFSEFIHVSEFYKKVINLLRQMNFNEFKSPEFLQYEEKLEKLLSEKKNELVEV